jgi:hypothetical protein
MNLVRSAIIWLSVAVCVSNAPPATAKSAGGGATSGGAIYAQCLYQGKVSRWIPQQMPFKVWVSHGLTMDQIIDPATGAPVTSKDNTAHWGDAVIQVLQSGQLDKLPRSEGYTEDQYVAACRGILAWKSLEKEGLLSYDLTDSPDEADVYVFWTPRFVNKLGLALFENDIRGETSRWLLPAQAVISAMQKNDLDLIRRSRKPVVILLRTTLADGTPMPPIRMQENATHEMGHCLGYDGHSPNAIDIMSASYGGPRALSGPAGPSVNDLATLRWLYHKPAEMIP